MATRRPTTRSTSRRIVQIAIKQEVVDENPFCTKATSSSNARKVSASSSCIKKEDGITSRCVCAECCGRQFIKGDPDENLDIKEEELPSEDSVASSAEPSAQKKKPHVCKECGRRFARKSAAKRHQIVHTGEKRHACDKCEKRFSSKAYLTSHRLVHTNKNSLICRLCDKSFASKVNLTAHHRRIHAGDKPHSCDECEKQFFKKSTLKMHKFRCHTAESSGEKKSRLTGPNRERPFACSLCDKRYFTKYNLEEHKILVHY